MKEGEFAQFLLRASTFLLRPPTFCIFSLFTHQKQYSTHNIHLFINMPGKKERSKSSSKPNKRKDSGMNSLSKKSKKDTINDRSGISLTSSIFGSSGGGDQKNGESLSSSIFGNITSAGHNHNDLFASADKWQQVSENRVKMNTNFMVANDTAAANANVESPNLTRAQIIKARKDRVESKEAIDLTNSITVHVPEINVNDLKGVKEEEKDEVIRGIIKMFTIQCDTLMRENGVVIIKSKDRMIARNCMQSLTSQSAMIEDQVCTRLKKKGNVFHVSEEESGAADNIHSCASAENREIEQNHSFLYHEVASRCLGRLDIRYKMDEAPFNQNEVVSNEFIKPVVNSLLGKDAKLVYAGLILSFPLSADQPWHQDGTALFEDNEFPIDQPLPPYALNIFIPLDDVTEELGPTEFCVGSHYRDQAIKVMKHLENGNETGANVVGPLLKTGDALIYDYRVCHRGTQNLSRGKTRPMLYLMYARPWFNEHVNFSEEKLFD